MISDIVKKTLPCALLFSVAASDLAAEETVPPFQECRGQIFSGEYIIQYKHGIYLDTPQQFNIAAGGAIVDSLTAFERTHTLIEPERTHAVITAANSSVGCEDFINQMNSLWFVEFAQPNYIVTIDSLPPVSPEIGH